MGRTPAPRRVRRSRRGHPQDVRDENDVWLDEGEPPVYVGFGSMPLRDPVASYGRLLDAIASHGLRVLLCAGPNGPAAHEAVAAMGAAVDVHVTDAVDHRRVLPRCVAAIHHGGAGTTAACLRAGTPMVIASFSADQPLWGRVVADRGLGATLPVRALSDHARLRDAVGMSLTDRCTNSSRSFAGEMIDVRDSVRHATDIVDGTDGSRSSIVRSCR